MLETQSAAPQSAPVEGVPLEGSAPKPQNPAHPQSTPDQAQKPKEEPASKHFAAMARREKHIQQLSEQYKAQERAIAEREAKVKEMEEQYKVGKDKPLELLKKLGISYQDLTAQMLNDGKPTPEREIQKVREEFERYRQEQEQKAIQAQEEQKKAQENSLKEQIVQFKEGVKNFVSQNSEEYELTNLFGQEELIYSTIEAQYEQNQKILSVKEASDLVEKYLEGQLEAARGTKKFKAKFLTPGSEKAESGKDTSSSIQEGFTKTLSNSMDSSISPASDNLSDEERYQRAMRFLDSI